MPNLVLDGPFGKTCFDFPLNISQLHACLVDGCVFGDVLDLLPESIRDMVLTEVEEKALSSGRRNIARYWTGLLLCC